MVIENCGCALDMIVDHCDKSIIYLRVLTIHWDITHASGCFAFRGLLLMGTLHQLVTDMTGGGHVG